MQETISKKDECIVHLKTIIDTLKSKGKDSTFIKSFDLDLSREWFLYCRVQKNKIISGKPEIALV